jgi:hypothetical protein
MGDALFHIAWSEELTASWWQLREKERDATSEPILDEDEII